MRGEQNINTHMHNAQCTLHTTHFEHIIFWLRSKIDEPKRKSDLLRCFVESNAYKYLNLIYDMGFCCNSPNIFV